MDGSTSRTSSLAEKPEPRKDGSLQRSPQLEDSFDDVSTTSGPLRIRIYRHLGQEVDKNGARLPLAVCSFLSGFIACVSFSACSIWPNAQTGNTIQTAIAISRAVYDPSNASHGFRTSDWQAFCSVSCFALAAQLGGRIISSKRKTRGSIAVSAFLQTLLTSIACVTAHHCNEAAFNSSRTDPSWHDAYGFATIALLSASMGLQGIVGEAMGTGFTATVVLTSIWVQLALNPWPWRKTSPPRDDRVVCIILFCLGAFLSRIFLVVIGGSAGTLAMAAGLRALLVPVWLTCAAAKPEDTLPTADPKADLRRLELQNVSSVTMVEPSGSGR